MRVRLLLCALLSWLACFVVLSRSGSWTLFAFVGVLLAALTFLLDARSRPLLRPSSEALMVGLSGGLAMVVLTHAAYALVGAIVPSVRPATLSLLSLLNVAGFSSAVCAGLIVVIASCEEVLFRGPLWVAPAFRDQARLRWPRPAEWASLVAFAVLYALTTAPLGSPLLVLCAFACGTVWGSARIATASIIAPILMHVIWDLGVLLVWPLSA